MRIFALLVLLDTPWLMVGFFAAGTGRRWGAYVLIAWLATRVGLHLIVGTLMYREVMARPWPLVAALPDDAWDD
jgi:hypothetical protein